MTKNLQRETIRQQTLQRLRRENRLLALQREALILLTLALATVLGVILILT